jgi:hypothetical protein
MSIFEDNNTPKGKFIRLKTIRTENSNSGRFMKLKTIQKKGNSNHRKNLKRICIGILFLLIPISFFGGYFVAKNTDFSLFPEEPITFNMIANRTTIEISNIESDFPILIAEYRINENSWNLFDLQNNTSFLITIPLALESQLNLNESNTNVFDVRLTNSNNDSVMKSVSFTI